MLVLEELHRALVLLGFLPTGEGAEVAALAGPWISLSRIEAEFAGFQLANHDDSPVWITADPSVVGQHPPPAQALFRVPMIAFSVFRSLGLLVEPTAAEDLERERDGREGADEEERPANSLALVHRQAIRQQQAESSAEGRAGAGKQGQFRQRNSGFSHEDSQIEWAECERIRE